MMDEVLALGTNESCTRESSSSEVKVFSDSYITDVDLALGANETVVDLDLDLMQQLKDDLERPVSGALPLNVLMEDTTDQTFPFFAFLKIRRGVRDGC